jgi:hypothetical protein
VPHNSDDEDRHDGRVVGPWYATSFEVGHNAFEFKVDCGHELKVDFGHDDPEGQVMTVYFRVIASPGNARELFRLLGAGLLRYADAFGPIDDPATTGGSGA